jgi:hypothetical protein
MFFQGRSFPSSSSFFGNDIDYGIKIFPSSSCDEAEGGGTNTLSLSCDCFASRCLLEREIDEEGTETAVDLIPLPPPTRFNGGIIFLSIRRFFNSPNQPHSIIHFHSTSRSGGKLFQLPIII